MQDGRTRVSVWLRAHAEEMVEDLRSFARIRSVCREDLKADKAPYGPECRRMLDFALNRAREMGFETEDHDGYCGSAVLGDGENAIAIIGHLDVVPEGDQWIYPPYAATRAGDFLIGRGVSDNKSAVAMGLYLMRMFRELEIPLRHGLRVVMGCAEETGMTDIRHFAKSAPRPVLSLIPDSMFPANYAQKGSLQGMFDISLGEDIVEFGGGEVFNMVPPRATALLKGVPLSNLPGLEVSEESGLTRVVARGVASHAARPADGVSAIHKLSAALLESGALSEASARAMAAVKALSGDIYGEAAGIASEDPDTGRTTMVVGLARTENGLLSFSVDSRLSLNGDGERDTAALHRFARGLGLSPRDFRATRPVYMPKDDPRVEALQRAYFDATGDPAGPYTTGGNTYARELENAVTFGISFPGEQPRPDGLPEAHGGAHAPDEYLHIPSLIRAAEIYAHAILTLDPSLGKEGT